MLPSLLPKTTVNNCIPGIQMLPLTQNYNITFLKVKCCPVSYTKLKYSFPGIQNCTPEIALLISDGFFFFQIMNVDSL